MSVVVPGKVPFFEGSAALAPSRRERVMRVRGDVRLGTPVVLTSGASAALVVAVEMLSPARHAALLRHGQTCHLALTRQRLSRLGLVDLPKGEVLMLALSQHLPLSRIKALADPGLAYLPSGALAGVCASSRPQADCGDRLHAAAIALAKSAQLLPAALLMPLQDGPAIALQHGLSLVDADDALAELATARLQEPVSTASLPMAVSQSGRVHVYRPDDGSIEHYAIEIGTLDLSRPVLVRMHSACFTGDVLGSLKCDCGPQLQAACATMAAAGGGVLLYLNQEGRGIGMANKMRAYALQDRGLDTVEANHHLGFRDDERDFRHGAALLEQLGIAQVRVLTNNPAKLSVLEAQGITVVERVALEVGKTTQNATYLATKAAKSGHLLT
ncbi:MAG: GTP cyclohydrolase II [Roseinatronobacter sp.]